jgi:hypothetical protein
MFIVQNSFDLRDQNVNFTISGGRPTYVPFRAYPGFMQAHINPKDSNESLLWYNLCDFFFFMGGEEEDILGLPFECEWSPFKTFFNVWAVMF